MSKTQNSLEIPIKNFSEKEKTNISISKPDLHFDSSLKIKLPVSKPKNELNSPFRLQITSKIKAISFQSICQGIFRFPSQDQLDLLKYQSNQSQLSTSIKSNTLDQIDSLSSIKTNEELEQTVQLEALMNASERKVSKFLANRLVFEGHEEFKHEDFSEENKLNQLKKAFHGHYLFWNVDEENIKSSLPYISLLKFKPQQIILNQGETSNEFFILQSGTVIKETVINGQQILKLEKNTVFGEKSLFDQTKRTSSYRTETNCLLWSLNIATFFKFLKQANLDYYNENSILLNKIKLFKQLSPLLKDEISMQFSQQIFQKNEIIMEKGNLCACFFILKKGKLLLTNENGDLEKTMLPGDFLGDWSLRSFFLQYNINVSHNEEAIVLVVSNKTLKNVLGDTLFSLSWKNLSRLAFSQSTNFARLTPNKLELIIDGLDIYCLEKGQTICNKDAALESIFVILEGNLIRFNENKEEICAEECSIFGENELFNNSHKLQNLYLDQKGVVGEISRSKLEKILDCNLTDFVKSFPKLASNEDNLANDLDKPIDFDKIEVLSLIGDGQFGVVLLARYNEELVALKLCSKSYIVSRRFELYLRNEKIIQNFLGEFPFLIKFHRSFKDENLIYFMMDFVAGKDLSSIFYDGGKPFTIEISRFYVMQMVLVLEYLQSKKILHRDIKLNNILVDHEGYIKLIDFGISKVMKNEKTFSLVGTPHYMAPEVILGRGYSFMADIWSVGVCLYELLFGKLPFGHFCEDPIDIYTQIIGSKLEPLDEKKRNKFYWTFDLIERFLEKNERKRIDVKSIKNHNWFIGNDWNDILLKKLKGVHRKNLNLDDIFKQSRGKNLIEFLKKEKFQNYIKREEKKISKIRNWDSIF